MNVRIRITVQPDIQVVIEGNPVDVVALAAKCKDYLEDHGLEPRVEILP